MYEKVQFDNCVQFLGRNGVFECRGFMFSAYKDCISIYPIISKGVQARCFIEIPLDHIETFHWNLTRRKKTLCPFQHVS